MPVAGPVASRALVPLSAVLLALGLAVSPVRGRAQDTAATPFEGIVTFQGWDRSGSHAVTYTITRRFVRVDVQGAAEPSTMIIDADAQLLYVVLPARQTYMQLRIPPVESGGEAAAGEQTRQRTGKRRKVAGHRCEVWLIREPEREVEVCAAGGLGAGEALEHSVDRRFGGGAWFRHMAAQGLLPLRVTTRDARGEVLSRLEATRVERRPLDRALFRPPPDYRKLLVPVMRGPAMR